MPLAKQVKVIITKYHENVAIINIIVSIMLLMYIFVQMGHWIAEKPIDQKYDIIFTSLGLGVNIISSIYIWYNTRHVFKITPEVTEFKQL